MMDGCGIPGSLGAVFSAAFWDAFWGSSEFIVLPVHTVVPDGG